MKKHSYFIFIISIVVGTLALTGCPPKNKLPIEEKKAEEVKPEDGEGAEGKEVVPGPDEVQIRQDWSDIPSLELVLFDYDSSSLNDKARASLKTNVAILKKLPKTVTIRVEGHCDDRGTVEYNLALGQKRANSVQSYYATSGIAKSRLETISFGEERPLCNLETDECWAQNRRSATKVKNPTSIILKKTDLQ